MIPLKEIMNKNPLINRLVVGGMKDLVAAASGSDNILIVALEGDYLFAGINIKNALEDAFGTGCVSAVSLDDCSLKEDKNLFDKANCVIAVGGRRIIDFARVNCENRRLIFAPTALDFYYAFSPMVTDESSGLMKSRRAKLPDAVVFDVGMIKRFRLKHLADAFTSVASAAFIRLDMTAAAVIEGAALPDTTAVDSALSQLKTLRFKPYETLLKCQIYLSYAANITPQLDFCADRYMAYALMKIKDVPEYECRFFCTRYLAKFYADILKKDVSKNLVAPDYVNCLRKLADMLGADVATVLKDYEPHDENYCYIGLKRLYESDFHSQAVSAASLTDGYLKAYGTIYKGRRKRVDVENRTAVKALSLSAFTCEGLLRVLADSGIVGMINV